MMTSPWFSQFDKKNEKTDQNWKSTCQISYLLTKAQNVRLGPRPFQNKIKFLDYIIYKKYNK
jgi:hypothetical protein